MNLKTKKPKILDLDIENRPLSYLGQDFTTAEITAIAWSFGGGATPVCFTLAEHGVKIMLESFRQAYDEADIVTGHYILMHDLPIINGAFIEQGIKGLGPKLVSDTKVHLITHHGLSKSQENLSEMFGLPEPKQHMNTPRWREANRLTPQGTELTRRRVIRDVKQHMLLRTYLVQNNLLKPPQLWCPGNLP